MDYKDYYQSLGIDKKATAEEIKKAYRKKVRKYHPDVSKEKDADKITKELNEAYSVLGDQEKRAAYDELGRTRQAGKPFQPPPDWGSRAGFGGFDGADPFSDLFAHVGRQRRGGAPFQTRGEDVHATINVDLSDAFHGATRTVSLRMPQPDAHGRMVTQERTLSVNIPRGITGGQQLRLAGQGHPGSGGGPSGDLFLEIVFNPDARYRIEGRDLYLTVPVTPWEAALGAEIDVPTPAGRVHVNVPAGSQSGRKLRLKGRGIPAHPAGELYLLLELVLPPADTDQARALYAQMASELAFNPRQKLGD